MDRSNYILSEPAVDIELSVETDGVWIHGGPSEDYSKWGSLGSATRLGRLLPFTIPQLLESGLALASDEGIRISHADFVTLEENGIDAFADVAPWAPFTLEVQSRGWTGDPGFTYLYGFYLGREAVYPDRLGCFLRRDSLVYRLDPQTFALVEAIDSFNSLSGEEKASSHAFIRFAEIKGLAEGIGAQLDRFLSGERVIVANRVGLDLVVEPDGRITFVPKIDGVPDEAMRRAFIASDDAEEIYSIDDGQGGRVRVILDDMQREVLRRMQLVRHLGGAERAKVLRDPHAAFDGVTNHVEISPDLFGPRVKGIGDFPFVVQPYVRGSGTGIFEGPEVSGDTPQRSRIEAGLECRYADGSVDMVSFSDRTEVIKLRERAHDAARKGLGVVEFRGKSIALERPFIQGLDELVAVLTKQGRGGPPASQRRFLLIYTNEETVEYAEPSGAEKWPAGAGELPGALRKDRQLKDHQRDGLTWLQHNFQIDRRGCLLADDMGLGKTLQVLAFLAWLIERGGISADSPDGERPPWDPILVIAPLMLLENETWMNDIREFFEGEGAVFQPWLVLRGRELNRLKKPEAGGKRETIEGLSALDVTQFRNYRLIFTNYETVTNYQHSFARADINWSVVVTDEAQEYKTPNTKISHALKSLTPRFRIACTGTPVETRLLDIWNIFDFLQPGTPLGSAAEFNENYEKPWRSPTSESETGQSILGNLRDALKIGRPNAHVMRRDKKRLPGLPTKEDHIIECMLSDEQRQWHLDLVRCARDGRGHPLELMHKLMDVYQHPALVPRYEGIGATEALARCPKLVAVLECLRRISAHGEKALVFARRIPMQQLLADVFAREFGLPIDIINGVRQRGETQGSSRTRRMMMDRFREHPGFNVIVLSPEVAGIGLTFVEANHVIHYGRWWNPAREAQATDRVYRIGQTRDVHVYYPVAGDPLGEFPTFDEKLHELILRRHQMAQDFLMPMPTEGEMEQEILGEVLQENGEKREAAQAGIPQLDLQAVRTLTAARFEALAATLAQRRGASVVLTPLGGDGGIDVVAFAPALVQVIQCKHSIWDMAIDSDVLAELIRGFEGYRARWLRTVATPLRPVLFTNGLFTKAVRVEASERGIELIDRNKLAEMLVATPCTAAEVEAAEDCRLASMSDFAAAVDRARDRG